MKRPGKFTLTATEAYNRGRSDALGDTEYCELIPAECRTPSSKEQWTLGYARAWKAKLAAGAIGGAA